MVNLSIKDRDKLKRILRAVSWLDSLRWKHHDNYNYINFFSDDLKNSEKILTHWICYITDRQMPFEIIWNKGGYVFSELVHEYSKKELSPKETLDKQYEKYENKKGEEKFRFKSIDSKTFFASRYVPDDYQNILQTLEILDHYNRNIIDFIADIVRKFESKDDLLIRVAFGLHLLSYQLKKKQSNHYEILNVLKDNRIFEKKLKEFISTSTSSKKRLWCSVRDYKKGLYSKVFKEAVKELQTNDVDELIEIWDNLPLNQLELPGDVWNNSPSFRDNLIANVIDIRNIPKSWTMPRIVRELYNLISDKAEIDDFYPEQFDITFDFVPRMCENKLCNICLFGKNGIDLICIPTKNKYCPVALVSCGYLTICMNENDNCMIKENVSKSVCREDKQKRLKPI